MLLKNARNDALARREFEDLLELSVRLGDPLLEKDARASVFELAPTVMASGVAAGE